MTEIICMLHTNRGPTYASKDNTDTDCCNNKSESANKSSGIVVVPHVPNIIKEEILENDGDLYHCDYCNVD